MFGRLDYASVRAMFAWLLRPWCELGRFYRHWLINIAIGVAIEVMLIVFHNNQIVVAAQNLALDTAMEVYSLLPVRGALLPLILIDVDEETWRKRGQRYPARRDDLLTLIDYAIGHDARYVVLDVIVERPNDREDIEFATAIEKRVVRLEAGHQHLLFVRTLLDPLEQDQAKNFSPAPEIHPSPLDNVIRAHPAQLHAVAPYLVRSRDGVFRDWQLWRPGCRRDPDAVVGWGHWEILPSAQLVVADLVRPKDPGEPAAPWESNAGGETCTIDLAGFGKYGAGVPAEQPNSRMLKWLNDYPDLTGVRELALPRELSSRIFFRFRYPTAPDVVRVQALNLIDPKERTKHRNNWDFAGGLVVIGQSHWAADWHRTPLGDMPGAMVLVNSVWSMLDLKLLHEPGPVFERLIQFASIVVIAGTFACTESTLVVLVMLLPLLALLIVMNYVLLRLAGVWIDVAIPLLGIWAHRQVSRLKYSLRAWRAGRQAAPVGSVSSAGGGIDASE